MNEAILMVVKYFVLALSVMGAVAIAIGVIHTVLHKKLETTDSDFLNSGISLIAFGLFIECIGIMIAYFVLKFGK